MSEFDYQQLDEIIHSKIRLVIMAFLISVESATFVNIREKIKTTDGNLSVHIRKLEEASYVSSTKRFIDRKPQTIIHLTEKGRDAFYKYVVELEKMIK